MSNPITLSPRGPEIRYEQQEGDEVAILFKSMTTGEVVRRIEADNLESADLSRMSLRGANLAGQNLRFANLRGADLTGCDLRKACLIGADLRGARMWDVDLDGALLAGAKVDDDAINSTFCPPWSFPRGYLDSAPGPALHVSIDPAREAEMGFRRWRKKHLAAHPPALVVPTE